MSRVLPLVLAVVVPLGIACTEPSAPAAATRTTPGPSLDLVTIEIDREVTAEEFALADKDQTGGICVKGTSSDNLLMMDANAATPSQPCPPAWQFVGKPMGIKIRKEWYTEDKNANGLVCVKFVTDTKTIVKDDNAGTPSQPCPPAFYAVGKTPSGPKVDADDLKTAVLTVSPREGDHYTDQLIGIHELIFIPVPVVLMPLPGAPDAGFLLHKLGMKVAYRCVNTDQFRNSFYYFPASRKVAEYVIARRKPKGKLCLFSA